MPVIPGFFKNFNELIDCSSDLTRITMNDEYKKVIIKNRLAGFPNAPAPDSIESFYDHIEEHATRVHNYLANQGRYAVNNWEELKADWFAYGTLVKNTDLFYRMIARLPPLPYYHGLDDELVKILTGDLVKLGRTLFPYTFKLNWRHII